LKLNCKFCVALIGITAFSTGGSAADPDPNSKPLSALPPGLEWADTNKDGQLSNDELKQADQILKDKLKDAKSNPSKKSKTSKRIRKK
jgi:hypothetical protein